MGAATMYMVINAITIQSFMVFGSWPNVQALATLPAGASAETAVEVKVTEKRRRNNGLVGVAQPRLVRLGFWMVRVMILARKKMWSREE